MQAARDTFYVALRTRLATINPARTIVIRGQVRPGILVDENELPTALQQVDAFTLRWTAMRVDTAGALPLVAMECEVHYVTDGTAANAGMDRGRLLAAMDGELTASLNAAPHSASKMNYSGVSGTGAAAIAMATNIFWSQPAFAPATITGERIGRVATIQVFSYQEAGEL